MTLYKSEKKEQKTVKQVKKAVLKLNNSKYTSCSELSHPSFIFDFGLLLVLLGSQKKKKKKSQNW